MVVKLSEDDGQLVFRVADDGEGFDMGADAMGRGLTNMTDRLDAIGGMLEIQSVVGRGTTIKGRIPVTTAASEANIRP